MGNSVFEFADRIQMSSRYFIKKVELGGVGHTLKLKQCEHCRMTGMLILHGFIYGYDEYRTRHRIKGRRVFCSNRNNRKGCGRTLSYLLIDFIKRTLISTGIAWQFLRDILLGKSIEKAYTSLDPECVLSLPTFFRFWKNFKLQTHTIRTFIANRYPLLKISESTPYNETIRHLSILFSEGDINPIAQYQRLFQTSFV